MKQLSPVVVRVIQKNAEVLEEFGISALPQDLQNTASQALGAIVASVEAQADDNPANADQVREIWFSFINQDASTLLNDEATKLVSKVGSEEVREMLFLLLPAVLNTLKEVTDENLTDNKEEVERIWKELVEDPQFFLRVFALVKSLL